MKSGRIFDVDSFRKNPWTSAFKKAKLQYKVPYTMRHTFAAWALTLRIDPNRLVSLMGHGLKEMVYEVYGNHIEGLETDAGKILRYFGKDFLGLKESIPVAFANNYGESWWKLRWKLALLNLYPSEFTANIMVEAAGVESEADITTIGVYNDLPNVYRMKDILMLVIKSSFQYYFLP
jgi:hypothetical protein